MAVELARDTALPWRSQELDPFRLKSEEDEALGWRRLDPFRLKSEAEALGWRPEDLSGANEEVESPPKGEADERAEAEEADDRADGWAEDDDGDEEAAAAAAADAAAAAAALGFAA